MGKIKNFIYFYDFYFSRYGDITPITPLGRFLACLAAIYGISIVSMLVSVLVGRYQRVYTRKRFLNEEYSDNMVFNNSFISVNNNNECLEKSTDIEKGSDHILECNDQSEEKQDNQEHPGKVRFFISCTSDDNEEDTDNNQDNNDGNETKLISKAAQELLQLKSNKYCP